MALVSVDGYGDGFYCRDREASRELFYIGLVHKLAWLPTNPWPSNEIFARTWAEDRSKYDRLFLKMGEDIFDSLIDYCSSRSISPTMSRFPLFPFWLPPELPIEATERKQLRGRLRKELLAKYGNKCQVCYGAITGSFHVHHIIPRSFGGPNSLSNLVPLHAECHLTGSSDGS